MILQIGLEYGFHSPKHKLKLEIAGSIINLLVEEYLSLVVIPKNNWVTMQSKVTDF